MFNKTWLNSAIAGTLVVQIYDITNLDIIRQGLRLGSAVRQANFV
jgi:hypothetical protein